MYGRLPLLQNHFRKIPSKKVYEDDKVYVFEDINPKAPTHVLIIPKQHIVGLKEASPEDAEILGYCQLIAAKSAASAASRTGTAPSTTSARVQGSRCSICTCTCSADAT